MTRRVKTAAGLFAAFVIVLALWRYPESAMVAIAAAFGLITSLLGLGA